MLTNETQTARHDATEMTARRRTRLMEEIENAKHNVHTDAYQMSIGELISMYESDEIIIDPEFQRLFRWKIEQKSGFIESILLGIPLPSIFVFELEDGRWELIDGLQRISTILEFTGRLKDGEMELRTPSVLEATKYLHSLRNVVWERSDSIQAVSENEQMPLERVQQLAIRRARIGVQILKRPSDNDTKYDLFQRLNASGTQANKQEIRNCIMIMINPKYFHAVKDVAEAEPFGEVISLTDSQREKQEHLEMAVRFLVHTKIPYDGQSINNYLDRGIVSLAEAGKSEEDASLLRDTFALLHQADGNRILSRYDEKEKTHRHYSRRVGIETIAVGVAKNLAVIQQQKKPADFVRQKARKMWSAKDEEGKNEVEKFQSAGLTGTVRIQRTVPFGERWFRP